MIVILTREVDTRHEFYITFEVEKLLITKTSHNNFCAYT